MKELYVIGTGGKHRDPCETLANFSKIIGITYEGIKLRWRKTKNKPPVIFNIRSRNYYLLSDLHKWNREYNESGNDIRKKTVK